MTFVLVKLWLLVTCSTFCHSMVKRLNQAGQDDVVAVKDDNSGGVQSTMDAVLSLDDGRWLHPAEDLRPQLINEVREDLFQFSNIHQPNPPPVLARVQQDVSPIPPSKVADPRPGPAKSSQDGMPNSNSYQHLHVVGPCAFFVFFFTLYICKALPQYLVAYVLHSPFQFNGKRSFDAV